VVNVVLAVEDVVTAVEGLTGLVWSAGLAGLAGLAGWTGLAGLAGIFVAVVGVVNSVIGHAVSLEKLWLVSLCQRKVDNMAWSTSILKTIFTINVFAFSITFTNVQFVMSSLLLIWACSKIM
jgi:hypothetical protein